MRISQYCKATTVSACSLFHILESMKNKSSIYLSIYLSIDLSVNMKKIPKKMSVFWLRIPLTKTQEHQIEVGEGEGRKKCDIITYIYMLLRVINN